MLRKITLFWLLSFASFAVTPERWADQRLKVTSGLEMWLDASNENQARESLNASKIGMGGPVDVWHDASGNHRDLFQIVPTARPHLKRVRDAAFMEFDGKDDFMAALNTRITVSNLTIIVYANPHSNVGFFRGLVSLSEIGRNDYTSGINLDLGPASTPQFANINVEGKGFGGAVNLLRSATDFNRFRAMVVNVLPGEIQLWMDGKKEGTRSRSAAELRTDVLTVAARFYSNAAEPPYAQGLYDGSIAEVLLYNRSLSDAEIADCSKYLKAKYAAMELARGEEEFIPVADPPAVQMLVPGFTVRELPVKLKNINNVKYRPDGKLVAVGYDGAVYLLEDTDGDGVEDKAKSFWEAGPVRAPIGLALTPPNYPRGQGVFLPSKGKVSLIVDTNKDDVADQEIIVAKGWPELPHGVDALGIAVGKDGSVYFGLGTANFTDAYLIDRNTGKARYSLGNERGTILKVSPDFTSREIYCTGIRFPVAMAFNSEGDLFSTDQEGATWLPNGNPLDELLQIKKGLHYGFPPRHPKHLPGVIDEPSVFDYAPQHQSICGLNFNLTESGSYFGPASWKGDALVTGYSRGKLYRTKLVKTEIGYVAETHLFAQMNMLAVDVCVSPTGDLVVAGHSGQPDWGSGPDGSGKLYKIHYAQRELAQPLATVSASVTDIKIYFDRALQPEEVKDWTRQAKVLQGKYVSAGERFESLRPGYQVVQDQLATPRTYVPVLSASLSPDRRTFSLITPSRPLDLNYAITLPRGTNRALATDLLADSHGCDATFEDEQNKGTTTWLPHVDLNVAKELLAGSGEHEAFWKALGGSGTLTLRTKLDLWKMLQPLVQPGAKLDYVAPPEKVTVVLTADHPFTLHMQKGSLNSKAVGVSHTISMEEVSKENGWLPLELEMKLDGKLPTIRIAWSTADDSRIRPFPLRRFYMPWISPTATIASLDKKETPEIAGGNWLQGKRVFYSEKAACFKCHQVRGIGGVAGPDLSNLVQRDYASVLRDITAPNAALNPDHLAYSYALQNGEELTGVPRESSPNEVRLALASGEIKILPKAEIASSKPSSLSLMPEGFGDLLGKEDLKNLLTFLLIAPLEPAAVEAQGEPPARLLKEIAPYLPAPNAAPKVEPMHVILVAGPKDHGPGEHDYPLWQKRWSKLLSLADGMKVEEATGWPSPAQMQQANLIVMYSNNEKWSAERAPELDRFLQRGGGLVLLHFAVDGHNHVEALSERIGLAWRGGASAFRHGPLDLKYAQHPITTGLQGLHLVDESYWKLVGDPGRVNLVASGIEENIPQPLLWTREVGQGRVFVSIPGHYSWSFDDPLFRLLIFRGMCWAAHQPLDRLNDLLLVGARVQ